MVHIPINDGTLIDASPATNRGQIGRVSVYSLYPRLSIVARKAGTSPTWAFSGAILRQGGGRDFKSITSEMIKASESSK